MLVTQAPPPQPIIVQQPPPPQQIIVQQPPPQPVFMQTYSPVIPQPSPQVIDFYDRCQIPNFNCGVKYEPLNLLLFR